MYRKRPQHAPKTLSRVREKDRLIDYYMRRFGIGALSHDCLVAKVAVLVLVFGLESMQTVSLDNISFLET